MAHNPVNMRDFTRLEFDEGGIPKPRKKSEHLQDKPTVALLNQLAGIRGRRDLDTKCIAILFIHDDGSVDMIPTNYEDEQPKEEHPGLDETILWGRNISIMHTHQNPNKCYITVLGRPICYPC